MLKSKLISVLMFLVLVQTSFGKQSDMNVDQILDIIITAQKAELAGIKQGKGLAKRTTVRQGDTDKPKEEEQAIRFYFKGEATRTDVLSRNPLEQNSFLYSEVDTGEFWYRYNTPQDNALVKKSKIARDRMFSRDFHPSVFYGFVFDIPLPVYIDKARKNKECDIKLNFTQEGLLELTFTIFRKTEGSEAASDFTTRAYALLDPSHSYRPLKWTYEKKGTASEGIFHKDERIIQWNDSSDFSYPTSITQSGSRTQTLEQLKRTPNGDRFPQSSNYKNYVEITNFEPNTQISDEIFTLKGMGVKDGTVIDDAITGILYRHGASQVVDEAL